MRRKRVCVLDDDDPLAANWTASSFMTTELVSRARTHTGQAHVRTAEKNPPLKKKRNKPR